MGIEILQTLDACVGITTALIQLFQFAVRYKHAGKIAEQTIATAEQIQRLLKQTRGTLSQRTPLPHGHPSKQQEDSGLRNIQVTVQKCDDTMKSGIEDLFGKKAVDRKNKKIREMHIALNPGRMAILKTELGFDLQILNTYFVLLLWQDNFLARSETAVLPTSIDGYYRQGVLQATLHQVLQQSSNISTNAMPQNEDSANIQPGESDSSTGSHLRAALSQSMTDVRAALQGSTYVSDGRTTEPGSASQDLTAEHRASDELPYPLEVLQEMVSGFSHRAAEAQLTGDWPLARRDLEGLISSRKQQARLTGEAFEDELVLEQMLVNVLLRLNQWDDALKRMAALGHTPVAAKAAPMNRDVHATLREAHREQATALVLLDRHSKSTSRDVGLANDDVESARLSAHRAYNLHYQDLDASPDSSEALARFEISARLLATSLRVLDRDGEADGISITAERRCGHSIESLANQISIEESNGAFAFDFEVEAGDDGEASSPRSNHPNDLAPAPSPNEWTNPRFTEAVKNGLVSEISRYLETHPDVVIDEQDENGWTALHHSVFAGNEDLVQLLIPHTKVDTHSHHNETALLLAISKGEPDIIKALAEHELFTSSRFADDCNVLHQAVYGNNTAAVKALLETVNGQRLTAVPDKAGMTALHLSASLGRTRQVGAIVRHCSAEAIDLGDCLERTALDLALNSSASEAWEVVGAILHKHRKARYTGGSEEAYKRYIAKRRRDSAVDER